MLKQIINQENPETGEQTTAASPGHAGANTPGANTQPSPQSGAPAGGPSTRPLAANKNILSSDVHIRGKLKFANDLIIDGKIEGEVNSEGDLTVGQNAQIIGDINTRSVVVYGKVEGNITVTDRCELKQNAQLNGDIAAAKLAIEEGAVFMGSSTVGGSGKAPAARANKPAESDSKPDQAAAIS